MTIVAPQPDEEDAPGCPDCYLRTGSTIAMVLCTDGEWRCHLDQTQTEETPT